SWLQQAQALGLSPDGAVGVWVAFWAIRPRAMTSVLRITSIFDFIVSSEFRLNIVHVSQGHQHIAMSCDTAFVGPVGLRGQRASARTRPEADGIARPVSAHRTMTSDSTNDKLLRIALREIMPISLLLPATQPSVTSVTALWFDGAGLKMVPLRWRPLGGPLFLTIHSRPHSCTENGR